MPSLRQKVTTYFRQLSFIAEPRDSPRGVHKTSDDGNFIVKYLEGRMERQFIPGPQISNGQNPTDLPDLKIGVYATGPTTITAACTGPDEGLTGIKRSKLHLSASYADDIDFIDTTQENDCFEVRKSITTNNRNQNKFNRYGGTPRKLSNSAITSNSDQNANKPAGIRSRKNSRTSITNSNKTPNHSENIPTDINTSKVCDTSQKPPLTNADSQKITENANKSTTIVVSLVSTKFTTNDAANDQNNKNILNSSLTDNITKTKVVLDEDVSREFR